MPAHRCRVQAMSSRAMETGGRPALFFFLSSLVACLNPGCAGGPAGGDEPRADAGQPPDAGVPEPGPDGQDGATALDSGGVDGNTGDRLAGDVMGSLADASTAVDQAPDRAGDTAAMDTPPSVDRANPVSPAAPAGSPCIPGQAYGDPLPQDRTAKMIRGGFTLAEGPVWVSSQRALFFSNFSGQGDANGKILKYTPANGTIVEFAANVGTNGLALDENGLIIAASHDRQRLTRFDPATGQRTDVSGGSTFMGRPFNQVNDVVVRSDGNIYFTDPDYQLNGRAGQDMNAFYRLPPGAAMAERLGGGNRDVKPNGIALSPDGRTLYVAGSGLPLRSIALRPDGSAMGSATVISNATSDGMVVDCAGNLYLTTGGGVTVLTASGANLGRIGGTSSGFITNVAFGGDDRKTLFITTSAALYQVALNIPGMPN
jgi:gluconolactonase